MRRAIVTILAVLALASCEAAPTAAQTTAQTQPAGTVRLAVEPGGRFVVLAGPISRHAAPFLGVASTNFYLLRSFIDTRSGQTAHQLYVEDSYPGAERHWDAARLATGEPLRFIPISKNEITCELGCSYAEEFAAALPEPLLRASPQGFTVLFTAHSGTQKAITVPPDLVAKQLAAIDQARATRPLTVTPGPNPAPPPPR
ncbi:MAG: hypothetical protein JO204_20700 [Alphaproteobacteria bacterium]|nr:hypothetical protein [Alphaproteobacteria bacterium]